MARLKDRSDTTIFAGAGDMRARCRAFDWSATSLGDVDDWSPALRTAAGVVLGSAFPMVLLWGPERVQIYNDGYIPFLAAKHPAGLGQRTRDIWPEVWHINAPIYERVATGETVFFRDARFPVTRRGPAGPAEDLYITLSYSPVPDEDGRVGGVLVTLHDTTEQVVGRRIQEEHDALEARLHGALLETALVLDQVRDAYMLMDEDFIITTVNQSAERTLSRPRAEIVGRSHWEVFPASVGAAPEREYRRVLAEQGESHFVHHYTGEGYDVHLEIDAYPAPSGGVAVFWRDISERIELLASTERARAEAEAARVAAEGANRSKGDFLAVMSHELRTPLNAIAGYIELMEMGIRGPITEAQRADLGRMQKSQRHLLGLITGVLDYAKVDAGAIRYSIDDVILHDVLESCETHVLPQAQAKGITLEFDGGGRLRVRADGEKLGQIILNMLSNAVKFTDSGGTVRVSCERNACSGGDALAESLVCIRVTDTGIGIAPDQLERIFQPFVQVDAKLTRTRGGTGLGLAISRDLARGMRGDLFAASTLGVGSTFTLELPAA